MLSQGFLHSPIGNLGNSQALALEQDISANPLPLPETSDSSSS
uniref:Uncharacterized protein n=1 Tax=Brassica campestris TaxID=3711 RepID=A0A3P6D9Y8_BRACM|nr:unnamed protein product [Brassica rapa]